VDLEIPLGEVTDELERLMRHLEPCGMGNPAPVFGIREVEFRQPQVVGQGHLKGILQSGETRIEAIGFQLADRVSWLSGAPVDAAVRLERNEFMGRNTLQARLVAVTPASSGP
jgi:single-stranded-DNA-specific exonuclease